MGKRSEKLSRAFLPGRPDNFLFEKIRENSQPGRLRHVVFISGFFNPLFQGTGKRFNVLFLHYRGPLIFHHGHIRKTGPAP